VTSTFISDFRSIKPKFLLKQEQAIQSLVRLRLQLKLRPEGWDEQTIETRIRRFGLANSQIETRGTEISDYVESNNSIDSFFKNGQVPSLEERMEFFKKRTNEVMNEFYDAREITQPSDIVHVTCTGYTAPNAAQELAANWAKKSNTPITVTNAYHMGCFASLPALRIAGGITRTHGGRVDIVHQEICSLHFDPQTLDPEQIVVQSLFADGHIRYSISCDADTHGFEVLALREEILPETSELMSWIPNRTHFAMRLAREVPVKIKHALKPFLQKILASAQISQSPDEIIFAIHPGGPKIIEAVENELDLTAEQTIESHDILRAHGNMSSATLPHIWQKILANPKRVDGQVVVSLAFGPGLTLSGSVFRLIHSHGSGSAR
jgi:predicted naringenin-chalcone synthase